MRERARGGWEGRLGGGWLDPLPWSGGTRRGYLATSWAGVYMNKLSWYNGYYLCLPSKGNGFDSRRQHMSSPSWCSFFGEEEQIRESRVSPCLFCSPLARRVCIVHGHCLPDGRYTRRSSLRRRKSDGVAHVRARQHLRPETAAKPGSTPKGAIQCTMYMLCSEAGQAEFTRRSKLRTKSLRWRKCMPLRTSSARHGLANYP